MSCNTFIRVCSGFPLADKSALGAINRPLLVRQASFGAGEIPSGAISDGRKLVK